jgi:hypothetical protein
MARRLTDKNDIGHGGMAIVWLPFTLCQLFRCNDGVCLGGFTETGKGIWMEIAACLALVAGITMLLFFAERGYHHRQTRGACNRGVYRTLVLVGGVSARSRVGVTLLTGFQVFGPR